MAEVLAQQLGAETATELLRTIWRIRLFEERVAQLKRNLQVHGLIHLSIGGEGVAAAVCGQLRDDDGVYSGHRAHGHAIAKGAPLDRVMAELMGRADGLCQGLGGSMHLVDVEHGFLGATGVVGGNLPLALGNALAARVQGTDAVTVVFFGDGAVQAGHFNESINLAALWELPVIFVCENNGFAEFTPRSAHTVVERVSDVVAPYGFERHTVDGGDAPADLGGVRAISRRGARRQRARTCSSASPTAVAATTRATPRSTAIRSPSRSGDSAIRSRACRLGRWRRAGSTLTRRRRSSPSAAGRRAGRGAVRPREPFPEPALAAELVYAPGAAGAAGAPPPPPSATTETGYGSTFVAAINSTLARAMRADRRVIVLGEDVAEGGPYLATAGLADEFGRDRVLNTPISEGAVCGVAIGAAQAGLRPVVEIMFIDFLTLALDQLANQAAKAHFMSGGQLTVPLVLRTQGGAGQRSGAQHSQSLEAWLTHIPGLKVVMPSSAADAAGLLGERDRRPQPGRVRREQVAVLPPRARSGGARAAADRPRPRRAAGPRHHDDRDLADGRRRAVGRRAPGRRGRRGRGDRSRGRWCPSTSRRSPSRSAARAVR